MKVPLVDLEALHRPIAEELVDAARKCLSSQQFILGEEVERLEDELARVLDVPFAVGVSSGTDALLASLMALEIGPGDEVVTTAYSFFATAGVIVRLGARPAFADIDASSFNVNPSALEDRITERARAIVPVHLFGQCAEMAPILELAERRGLAIVEDAAQAIGARHPDGRAAGGLGRAGAFSFYPSKNLSTMGDAGLVVTEDGALAASLKRLRAHGASTDYVHEVVGGNFRLDALQAAFLRVKLPHLDEWNRRRIERAERYHALFEESGLLAAGLVQVPENVHCEAGRGRAHVYHQYVIRAERRDALREHLSQNGIGTAVYYPLPLHLQPCFSELGYREGDFPAAEKAARESLALPMHPHLTEEQQHYVVEKVAAFYAGA